MVKNDKKILDPMDPKFDDSCLYVEPSYLHIGETYPLYDFKALGRYCREKGCEPIDLTEERDQFLLEMVTIT